MRSSNGDHLHVQLLGEADANGDRAVTDSLTVENYYIDDSAKVERLEFEGTTIWSAHEFDEAQATAWVRGTNSDDTLDGTVNQGDVFDSNAGGDDILRGLAAMTYTGWVRGRVTIPYKNTITIAAITATKLRYIPVSGRIISVYHAVIMTI